MFLQPHSNICNSLEEFYGLALSFGEQFENLCESGINRDTVDSFKPLTWF